jgi:hypothetical protein
VQAGVAPAHAFDAADVVAVAVADPLVSLLLHRTVDSIGRADQPQRHRGHREEEMQNQGQRGICLFIMSSVGSVPLWFIFYLFCWNR